MSISSFSAFALSAEQLANLESLGYEQPTPVQAVSIPEALQGKDLIVQAKTGSGKTVAFGLSLLEGIDARCFDVQALVLCPTRELADQVSKELRKLARCIPNLKLVTLCGGKPLRQQADSLKHGAHIVVGTPGRIRDHLSRETLVFDGLKALVLDEADRMLDMGFQEDIEHIVRNLPVKRQTLLFSATYPDAIKKMCRNIQSEPQRISIDTTHEAQVIEQHFYQMGDSRRNDTLLGLFEHYQPESAVVFCHTKAQCRAVANFLKDKDIEATALHGDLEQDVRDEMLLRFSNRSCSVLVATDVAARGLDIKGLQVVINYELPHDPEIYVHRIGRTGRAGESGLALSLFTGEEVHRLIAIEEYQDMTCVAQGAETLNRQHSFSVQAPMTTLQFNAGKKNKIRPGDLLGALTKEAGLAGTQIGKIDIFEQCSYVAVERKVASRALNYFRHGKVKGRSIKARKIS